MPRAKTTRPSPRVRAKPQAVVFRQRVWGVMRRDPESGTWWLDTGTLADQVAFVCAMSNRGTGETSAWETRIVRFEIKQVRETPAERVRWREAEAGEQPAIKPPPERGGA